MLYLLENLGGSYELYASTPFNGAPSLSQRKSLLVKRNKLERVNNYYIKSLAARSWKTHFKHEMTLWIVDTYIKAWWSACSDCRDGKHVLFSRQRARHVHFHWMNFSRNLCTLLSLYSFVSFCNFFYIIKELE